MFAVILITDSFQYHFDVHKTFVTIQDDKPFQTFKDAFQGLSKDKYYYWIAICITLRSICFALYGFQTKLRIIMATMILIFLTGYHGYIRPNKNKIINIQELLLLINLTIMHATSLQCSENIFSLVTNIAIGLAFFQFCIIVLYHFLTHTLYCNAIMLHAAKQKVMKYLSKKNQLQPQNLESLNIPECTYNYAEFQDRLVSDDFK